MPVILGRIRHFQAVFIPERYYGRFGFSTAYKGKSDALRRIFVINLLHLRQHLAAVLAHSAEEHHDRHRFLENIIGNHSPVIQHHLKIRQGIPYLQIGSLRIVLDASGQKCQHNYCYQRISHNTIFSIFHSIP